MVYNIYNKKTVSVLAHPFWLDQVDKTFPSTLIWASNQSLLLQYFRGYMESIYTKLVLYVSKNECARTGNVFSPISEVCNGTWKLTIFSSFLVQFFLLPCVCTCNSLKIQPEAHFWETFLTLLPFYLRDTANHLWSLHLLWMVEFKKTI